jgi:T4 RnlA family RNA ligase
MEGISQNYYPIPSERLKKSETIKILLYLCDMKFPLAKLDDYTKRGLLFKQTHRSLPLSIWNYTPNVQYGDLWDEVTLACRGLVTDNRGNVVARPFNKFFNLEENKHTPTSDFEVFDKMDGSLGIMFKYNGEMICATRGSFTSDQSKWMTDFAQKYNYQDIIVDGFTYLFEIIYPENRIVVDYNGEERLVLLGIINTETGEELPHNELFEGFDVVKKYDGVRDYSELKGKVEHNSEGFVVRFSNGQRVKIKGEEYLRLHKIMTNVSTTGVWEFLSNGGDINEFLKDVPDEFYAKVKSYADTLRYGVMQVSEYCGKAHYNFRYGKYSDREVEPTKKEFAQHVMENGHPPYRAVMFAMWDGKPYDKLIWNIIKPEWKKL